MDYLQPNTTLQGGKYRIIKMLGQGSYGITYLALNTLFNVQVTIKEFFMMGNTSRDAYGQVTGIFEGGNLHKCLQKFRQEAQKLGGLSHPNIVNVCDRFDENCTSYYVMDYIEGDNLKNYVANHVISQQEATEIIGDVASALQYMHEEKNMLHLDVSPSNVMRRSSDGHIFLIDFGLSKIFTPEGSMETATIIGYGHNYYAPLEQDPRFAKDGNFRPTIDVYSLGATLFNLLTREYPPTALEVNGDTNLVASRLRSYSIPQGIANVVINAMNPNVQQRTQSARAFINDLQNAYNQPATPSVSDTSSDETFTVPSYSYQPASSADETAYAYSPTAKPKKKSKKWVWIILLLAIGGGIAAVVANQNSHGPYNYYTPTTTPVVTNSPTTSTQPTTTTPVQPTTTTQSTNQGYPSAQIKNVNIVHNQMINGLKCMVIHIAFDINNAMGHKCEVGAFFFDSKGNVIYETDGDGKYRAPDGQVKAGDFIVPQYQNTTCNDFVLSIPYSEIRYNGQCYLMVAIFDGSTKIATQATPIQTLYYN